MSDGPDGGRSALSADHSRADARGKGEPRAMLTLSGRSEHIEDEFDALADLFLSDGPVSGGQARAPQGEAGARARRAAVDRPAVEGLIVGHLPVSASSWVKTYAAMRARALGGPVGLIRVLGGTMMIDLVGVDSRGSSEEPEDLESAMSRLLARAVGIVVRVDEISEPELVGGAIDGLVVLSGADEAAIVGAFRTIKSLVGEESRGIEAPVIRAAILGAGRAEAGEAFERLARSVRHSLSCEITLAGSVERIVSEPSATLYHGAWEGSLGVLLDRLSMRERLAPEHVARDEPEDRDQTPARDARAAAHPEVGASERGPTDARADGEASGHEPHALVDEPIAPAGDAREGLLSDAGGGGTSGVDRADASGSAHEPEASPVSVVPDVPKVEAPKQRACEAPGGLAPLITGLSACAIRCPDDPAIEIAIDPEGGLVVVTEDLARGEGVAAWARRHAALIALAEPRMRLVREGVTLVVRDALRARPLLDTPHRILLLVEIGGQRGCVALN